MTIIIPAELSEILKQQLINFQSGAELEEAGTVLQVGDGIARIYGLSNVESNEMIEFESGIKGIVLNLEEDNVGAVLLGPSEDVKEGDNVKRLSRIASIMVGEKMLGRVINTLGEPIDGRGPISGELSEMPVERKAPATARPEKRQWQLILLSINAKTLKKENRFTASMWLSGKKVPRWQALLQHWKNTEQWTIPSLFHQQPQTRQRCNFMHLMRE